MFTALSYWQPWHHQLLFFILFHSYVPYLIMYWCFIPCFSFLLYSGFLPGHSSQSGILTHSRSSSKGSVEEIVAQPKLKDLGSNIRQKILLDYNVYMARCIPPEHPSPTVSPIHSADSSPTAVKKVKYIL